MNKYTLAIEKKKQNSEKNRFKFGRIVYYFFVVLLLFLILFPFIWLVISSFKFEKDIISWPPRLFADDYTLDNYIKVFKQIPMWNYIKNTVIFAGGVTIISVFLDSLAGYALSRMEFRGKNILYYGVLLTMMIPFQVYMIPLFLEISAMNLIDTYTGLILPRTTSAFGIFMMRSFFINLPKDLEEAARIDGLNEFQIFYKIMLPLIKPAMLSLGMFTLMNSWNDLLYPLMLTTTSDMRTLPAGLALFTGQHISFYGPVMAGAVVAMLPLLILYIFLQKYFVQGTATAGLKG